MITFREWLRENELNEATELDDFNKLRKILPKIFKVEEYFELKDSIFGRFSSSAYSVVEQLLKEAGAIEKAYVTKGAYASYMKWCDENGRGNYGTPAREYHEIWQNHVDEDDHEWLINTNAEVNQVLGKNDFYKKMASLVEKGLGKQKAAEFIIRAVAGMANSQYDRNLEAPKFFKERMEPVWKNKREIYDIFTRDSLRKERGMLDWINTLK